MEHLSYSNVETTRLSDPPATSSGAYNASSHDSIKSYRKTADISREKQEEKAQTTHTSRVYMKDNEVPKGSINQLDTPNPDPSLQTLDSSMSQLLIARPPVPLAPSSSATAKTIVPENSMRPRVAKYTGQQHVRLANGSYLEPGKEIYILEDTGPFELYPKIRSVVTGEEGRLPKVELQEISVPSVPLAPRRKGWYQSHGPQNLDGTNHIYPGDEFVIISEGIAWTTVRLIGSGFEGDVPNTTIVEVTP